MQVTSLRFLSVCLVLTTCLIQGLYCNAIEPPQSLALWEKGAPGSESRIKEAEKEDVGPGKCNVTNVHNPSLTPYLPKDVKTPTAAIVIAPGGGHRMLCLGHEGYDLGQWFADHGIAAFVLKYRLAREENSTYSVDGAAMMDTRRAIRMVRDRAADWKIKPDAIGVLGFSAGGELAALSAMNGYDSQREVNDSIDQQSARPDFQALMYPGSSNRFTVEKGMPPAFIVLGAKDRDDISVGMAELYLKYKKVGVPAELHIYSNAGHGFGYRANSKWAPNDWPIRMKEWMIDSKIIEQ